MWTVRSYIQGHAARDQREERDYRREQAANRRRGCGLRKGRAATRWRQKGYSEIRDLARQRTAAALATLAEICQHGENESVCVAAANAILSRGWGELAVPIVADDLPIVIKFKMGASDIGPGVTSTSDGRRRLPRLSALSDERN